MQGTPEVSVTGGIVKHFGAALLSHWDAADSNAMHSIPILPLLSLFALLGNIK